MLNVLELAGTCHIADVRVDVVLVVVLDVAVVSRLPVAWAAAVQKALLSPSILAAGNECERNANNADMQHAVTTAQAVTTQPLQHISQQSKHGCPGPRTIAYELIAHLQHARA
jgi:hypothetical protein